MFNVQPVISTTRRRRISATDLWDAPNGRTDGLPLSCSTIHFERNRKERESTRREETDFSGSSRKKKSAAANKDDRQLKDSKTSRLPPAAKSAWSTHGISIKFSVRQSTTRTKNHGKLKN